MIVSTRSLAFSIFCLSICFRQQVNGSAFHRATTASSQLLQQKNSKLESSQRLLVRGGSTAVADDDEDAEETDASDITQHPEFDKLRNYRMQQQVLLQLRATFLSEALAQRGIPLPTLADVATPEGELPPQPVDWDCAMATEEDPKPCLYSFDAEPDTKVVAPLGTTQWISLGALNRLRRTDPTKVEPMWHSKYAILQSWFDGESQYSLLQHVGFFGFLLNALLQGVRLNVVLALSLTVAAIVCMPILEYFVNRFLCSGALWMRWHQWSRFVHAALPLKLLLGQMAGKFIASLFDKLLGVVKEKLVELECQILEQHIPLTVGVPTIAEEEEDDGTDSEWGVEGDEDEEESEASEEEESDDEDY